MINRAKSTRKREQLGKLLQDRRKELRIKLDVMSVETGVAIGTLSKMERGYNTTLHNLILACRHLDLGITLGVSLGEE